MQPHALHLCLQLPHAVVLHAPPLLGRVVRPSSGGCRARDWRPRHVEGEGGGLGMWALDADSAFGSSLQSEAAADVHVNACITDQWCWKS